MIKIKKANLKDVEVLSLLGRITYTESHRKFINNEVDLMKYCEEAFSVAKISADLTNTEFLFYLMYLNDLPVGYGKLILRSSHECIASVNNCRLDKIYILNDFIGLNLGQKLFDFMELQAQQAKLNTIWLVVYHKNHKAIKFYEKNDFIKVGETLFPVNGTHYNNIILSKSI